MAQVKLGDVAVESRETYKGDKTGMPIVGLEHITPGEVTLSNWDTDTDNTFTKRFRKGDMLFGRRRAYLKKAAQAPFDGICSGDITVIRAKENLLLPELLPFIIQNDNLFDFAVGKSAGSLSPRVKWDNLKNYTFELPPMEEQRKLAEVLWSINDTLQAYQNLLTQTDALVQAQFVEMFGDPIENTKKWEKHPLSELCEVITGNTPARTHPEYYGDYIEWIKTDNITSDSVNLSRATESLSKKGATVGRIAPPCSILMTCIAGSLNTIGNIGITDRIVSFNQQINALVPYETNVWFLYQLLKMIRPQIHTATNKALKCILTKGNLSAIEIIAPDKNLQQSFAMLMQQANASKATLQNTITSLQATKRSILDRALGTGRKE